MQAYEIMRQVARNIDQVKRKLEQQTRVKELSGILDGWLGPGKIFSVLIRPQIYIFFVLYYY